MGCRKGAAGARAEGARVRGGSAAAAALTIPRERRRRDKSFPSPFCALPVPRAVFAPPLPPFLLGSFALRPLPSAAAVFCLLVRAACFPLHRSPCSFFPLPFPPVFLLPLRTPFADMDAQTLRTRAPLWLPKESDGPENAEKEAMCYTLRASSPPRSAPGRPAGGPWEHRRRPPRRRAPPILPRASKCRSEASPTSGRFSFPSVSISKGGPSARALPFPSLSKLNCLL